MEVATTPREKVALAVSDLTIARELRLQVELALTIDERALRRLVGGYARYALNLALNCAPSLRARPYAYALADPRRCSGEVGAHRTY